MFGRGDGVCQYSGVDLDETPPDQERGYVYGIECSRCPPGQRRSLCWPAASESPWLGRPDCGAVLEPAERHPDVLVVKEMTYEVCSACGERCGVAEVRKSATCRGGRCRRPDPACGISRVRIRIRSSASESASESEWS